MKSNVIQLSALTGGTHAFFGDGHPGRENITAREIVAALTAFGASGGGER